MQELLLAVFLGAAFLYVFYRAVEFAWPASYVTLDSGVEYSITASPARYTAFRFAPIFLASLFVAVSMDRVDGNAALAVAGVCAIHAASTNIWAIIRLVRSHVAARKSPLLLLHCVVVVGIAAAGLLALLLRSSLAPLVPSIGELSATLWTAILAAVVGAYIVRMSQSRTTDLRTAMQRSRRSVGRDLWEYAEHAALENSADPHLLRAIMLIENMQRPPWFRVLERIKGKLIKSGTYGVMQVWADHPLSDRESIARCAADRLARRVVVESQGYPEYRSVEMIARSYNDDPDYARNVAEVYLHLFSDEQPLP